MQGSRDSFLKSKKFFPKESEMRENFASGIRDPRFWNPLYRWRNLEYYKRLESDIQGPLTNTGIQTMKSGIHDVESKTVLDKLDTWRSCNGSLAG